MFAFLKSRKFKAIVAAKTRNAVLFRPSPYAVRCCERSVEILREAAEAARQQARHAADAEAYRQTTEADAGSASCSSSQAASSRCGSTASTPGSAAAARRRRARARTTPPSAW